MVDAVVKPVEKNSVIIQKNIPVNEVKGILYRIFLDDDVESPNQYRDIYNTIIDAKSGDEIELIVNTNGGYVKTTMQLYNALKTTKASTKAILYEGYSAGSILTLACEKIELTEFSNIMIHQMQSGTGYGDTIKMLDRATFDKNFMKEFYAKVYENFLTPKEFDNLYAGKEFLLNRTELVKRLKKLNK